MRERVRRLARELRDRANESDTVQLELGTLRRRSLEEGVALTTAPERPVPIIAVRHPIG